MAWTTELHVAAGFAWAADRNGLWVSEDPAGPTDMARVYAARVSSADVLAFIEDRGEAEVVVDSAGLRDVRTLELSEHELNLLLDIYEAQIHPPRLMAALRKEIMRKLGKVDE